jgi:hypothetical protein
MDRQQRERLRILDLNNITQGAVEQAVSAEYSASSGSGARLRTIRIENWQAPDPNDPFVRSFPGFAGGGRQAARVGSEVQVTTERIRPGRVAVFLVPNKGNNNPNIQQLARGTLKFKVGEADITA